MENEKTSLENSIEFLENKMKDPKVYAEWKVRMRPQLNDLKKELKTLQK